MNLVTNSIDAISKSNDKWIQIELRANDKFLIVDVMDSGRGIESAIVDKMFDPFFTTKEMGRGTGLGLSLCRSVVEMHKGSLEYIKGSFNTKFEIRLPVKD